MADDARICPGGVWKTKSKHGGRVQVQNIGSGCVQVLCLDGLHQGHERFMTTNQFTRSFRREVDPMETCWEWADREIRRYAKALREGTEWMASGDVGQDCEIVDCREMIDWFLEYRGRHSADDLRVPA